MSIFSRSVSCQCLVGQCLVGQGYGSLMFMPILQILNISFKWFI